MKIRNHRKYEWWFFPSENSKLEKHLYRFKFKADMMKFLNGNLAESINGTVSLKEDSFAGSQCLREWFVWLNDYAEKKEKLKIELRQLTFRGKKYIFRPSKVSKDSKKYFFMK